MEYLRGNIREKLEENVQSLKEVLVDNLPKRKESTTKRKFSIIMNDNRANYEPVDLSVDLCCGIVEDASNDSTEQSHKKNLNSCSPDFTVRALNQEQPK